MRSYRLLACRERVRRATITARPSTVRELFSVYGLEPTGCVRWAQPVREPQAGVYVIALTGDADDLAGTVPGCPLDPAALAELVGVCPWLVLDGAPTTTTAVGERIASSATPHSASGPASTVGSESSRSGESVDIDLAAQNA